MTISANARADQGHEVSLSVTLSASDPTTYTVKGWLTETEPGSALVLLAAGATESGLIYWDFPGPAYWTSHDPRYMAMRRQYSFVNHLRKEGFASLVIDRIGTGKSDHPASTLVTIESNVYVIDQFVRAARAGTLQGQKRTYSRIVGVGRSLSVAMMDMEAGVNHGLDGIISQSFAHNPEPTFMLFPAALEPAQFEPRLASLPPGYLTTRGPSSAEPTSPRQSLFFAPAGSVDPAVVAHEEANKETITDGEINTFFPAFGYSQTVTGIPVLNVLGDSDGLFCAPGNCTASAAESGAYPGASSFEAHVIAGVGHDMNLQYNGATGAFPVMTDWLNRYFPRSTGDADETH